MRFPIGLLLILLGSGGILGELNGLKIPSASWFFDTSRRLPFLNNDGDPWYGWVTAIGAILFGIFLLFQAFKKRKKHPAEIRRRRRFKEVKRGVWSLRILLFLVFLAGLDFLLVGSKPLALKYEGEMYYPAFERKNYKGKDFGVTGDLADAPMNFRSLKERLRKDGENWILMPPVPYDPAGDTQPPLLQDLTEVNGVYKKNGNPYSGLAARVYAPREGSEETSLHLRYRLRNGVFNGPADGWDEHSERVYSAQYKEREGASEEVGEETEQAVNSETVLTSESYYGTEDKDTFLKKTPDTLRVVNYHPAPPNKRHFLGTDSNGNDVLAYLFGGLQVNIQAAMFYIPCVYLIGVSIGLLMGYFGGIFDLVFQRIIEALEAIPFLFVIIIISSVIPVQYKGLWIIIFILVCFGWMGKTYLMRTAAYKEKARDYVASAKVLGASTPRVLRKHILPNILSILVTVIPFAISGVITSITSLDYLGFGLPPEYASWGKLLGDGLNNLSSPWLVTSAFFVLVGILTLITFVGEAVREAWDPRKFTTYR